MPKAVGYFREDSARHESCPSLTEQNRAFLEFCRRERLDVGATFLDTNAAHTGFRQMIEYLRRDTNGVQVVVDSLHRLGGDVRQAARGYFQLDGLGIPVVSLDSTNGAIETLISSWNTRDVSERLGERVRSAMYRKAVKGEVLGRSPYGYRAGPKHRLEPVPEEAAVVRFIFQLYTRQGLGIRLIARRLNEEGYRTRRNRNWSMVTIRDMLRNRVYLGTYSRFGVRVPGSHPAIVAPEDYRRAQDRMSRRRGPTERHERVPFLLSGLVQCGYCGNRMIGVSRRQSWRRQADGQSVEAEYRYYQCETRTNQSMCDYHTHRAAELDEEVRSTLETQLRRELEEPASAGEADPLDELSTIRARIRLLDRRLEQVLDAGAAGRFQPEKVRSLSVEIAQEQLALEESADTLERRTRALLDHEQQATEHRELLQRLAIDAWGEMDCKERQQLLHRLLQRIVLRDDSIELVRHP